MFQLSVQLNVTIVLNESCTKCINVLLFFGVNLNKFDLFLNAFNFALYTRRLDRCMGLCSYSFSTVRPISGNASHTSKQDLAQHLCVCDFFFLCYKQCEL